MARSQATPIVGVDAQFVLMPEAGGSDVVLWNTDWEINYSNAVAEAPNTTDGMIRATGLGDWEGTFKGKTNSASTAVSPEANVKVGKIYQFKAYRSKAAANPTTGFLIIKTLKVSTGVGSTDEWEAGYAKAYGALTMPNGDVF